MPGEDFFEEGEELPQEHPSWRAPVKCPGCGGEKTRFLGLNYEMSVYVCEVCSVQFELDELE